MKIIGQSAFMHVLVCSSVLLLTSVGVIAQECVLPSTLTIESSQGTYEVLRDGQSVSSNGSGILCIGDTIAVTGDGSVTLRDSAGQGRVLVSADQSPFKVPLSGTMIKDADSDDRCIGCTRKVGQSQSSDDGTLQDAGSPARSGSVPEQSE